MPPSAFLAYVRAHLPPLGLDPDREAEIVEELAQQMEQTYDEARAAGADRGRRRAGGARRRAPTGRCSLASWSTPSDRRRRRRPGGSPARCSTSRARAPRPDPRADVAGRPLRPARGSARHPGFTAAALAHAGADHRRQLGDLQPGQRGAAGAAAVPRRRPDHRRQRGGARHRLRTHPFSPLDYQDYAAGQRSFGAVAAYRNGSVELAGEGESERIDIAVVSPSIFDVLGVQPSLGRAFAADDARPGGDAAILSHALWTRRFAADPAVVGRRRAARSPAVRGRRRDARARGVPASRPAVQQPARRVLVPLVFSEPELQARGTYYANSVLGQAGARRIARGARRPRRPRWPGRRGRSIPPEVQCGLQEHGDHLGAHAVPRRRVWPLAAARAGAAWHGAPAAAGRLHESRQPARWR